MVTKLEENVQKLIAYKLVTSVTGTVSDRAKRKYEKIGVDIGKDFKNKKKLPETSYLTAELKWSDDAASWARKQSLGIEEFKQEYPDYGKILDEKLQKHREVRRAYLEFGVREGDLPEDIYLSVIKELDKDISDTEAKQFYNILKKLNKKLKKKETGLQKFLLPE